MGCIEIRIVPTEALREPVFNRNMGCIEMHEPLLQRGRAEHV